MPLSARVHHDCLAKGLCWAYLQWPAGAGPPQRLYVPSVPTAPVASPPHPLLERAHAIGGPSRCSGGGRPLATPNPIPCADVCGFIPRGPCGLRPRGGGWG